MFAGFNVETVKFKSVCFTVWDVGGQNQLRPLWRHYFKNTDALIYVIDSSDRERMAEAAHEFQVRMHNRMYIHEGGWYVLETQHM